MAVSPSYAGMWVDEEPRVTVTREAETAPLNPCQYSERESGTGFAWGFAGPASRQLARAILSDYFADDSDQQEQIERCLEAFHLHVVAGLPPVWVLHGEVIADFLGILAL